MPVYQQSEHTPGHLRVVELFETIQGEGIYTGVPSVFFRTGMCNLECSGCDTKWDIWTEKSIEQCVSEIRQFKAKHLVITGGEPTLWQADLATLVEQLGQDYVVTIETNGAVPIVNEFLLQRVDLWSFSPKVGSLGFGEKFSHHVVLDNLELTRDSNQLKYVLDASVQEHVDSVFTFQEVVDGDAGTEVADDRVFFQPYDRGCQVNVYNRILPLNERAYSQDLAALTKLVLERSGSRFRVCPQLHKYLLWR